MQRYDAVLVTHTHWDREWYLPVEEYRFRLVELIHRLLDILAAEPEYPSYWLDGQTVPVEDYAAVSPPRWGEFERALRERKALIGPWYILADQWLASGESCVRNLLMGRRDMERFGQRNDIGYVPDNFGHMDQLPQILLNFGMDNAMFWRGYRMDGIEKAETNWTGIDGSTVRAFCLVGGYSNARGITEDLDATAERLDARLPDLMRVCGSGTLLLMNGIDHALPTPRVARICAALEERYPGLRVRHGDLAEFLEAIRGAHAKHKPLRGELHHVLGLDGCLSNRPMQKRLNRLLENRLAHYAEPLAVYAGAWAGDAPERGFLARAWKMLVRCHPHDSISGCHSDDVAADLESRQRRGLQVAGELQRNAVARILGGEPRQAPARTPCWIAVFNPAPWPRDEAVEAEIHLPAADLEGDLVLTGSGGAPVPSRVLSAVSDVRRVYHDYSIPDSQEVLRAKVVFRANALPPGSFTWFRVAPRKAGEVNLMEETEQRAAVAFDPPCPLPPGVLDNGLVRVEVRAEGSFDLADLPSGAVLKGLNALEAEADRGDLYAFRPALNPCVAAAEAGTVERSEWNAVRQAATVRTAIMAGERRVPLSLTFTLCAGKRRVEIRAEVDNSSEGFRLRAAFPLPAAGTGRAHTPFSLSPRKPVAPAPVRAAAKGWQLPSASAPQPMQYAAEFDLKGGGTLALMNRGLYEYCWEATERPCLTLMRAVGEIRGSLRCHTAIGGQSKGMRAFEYAVLFRPEGGRAIRDAYEYSLPPAAEQVFAEPQGAMPGVEFTQPAWMPAALKPKEEGSGFVLRFWNASGEAQRGEVKMGVPFQRVCRARMDETALEEVPHEGGTLELETRGFEVVTLVFEGVGEHEGGRGDK